MVKVENETVETYGSGIDMIAEATIGVTEVIKRVSEEDEVSASALLYSVVSGVALMLEKQDGIHIDLGFIAKVIMNKA